MGPSDLERPEPKSVHDFSRARYKWKDSQFLHSFTIGGRSRHKRKSRLRAGVFFLRNQLLRELVGWDFKLGC